MGRARILFFGPDNVYRAHSQSNFHIDVQYLLRPMWLHAPAPFVRKSPTQENHKVKAVRHKVEWPSPATSQSMSEE